MLNRFFETQEAARLLNMPPSTFSSYAVAKSLTGRRSRQRGRRAATYTGHQLLALAVGIAVKKSGYSTDEATQASRVILDMTPEQIQRAFESGRATLMICNGKAAPILFNSDAVLSQQFEDLRRQAREAGVIQRFLGVDIRLLVADLSRMAEEQAR